MDDREGYVQTDDGLQLYYRMVGDLSNTLVIPLASSLAADLGPLLHDSSVLFYDQRGRGRSDPVGNPDLISLDHEVRDLETIRQHFHLDQMAVLGWSYLGAVAALYASSYPHRISRQILMCPMPPRSYFSVHGTSSESEAARQKLQARTDAAGVTQLEQMRQAGLDTSDPISYCRTFLRVYGSNMMGQPTAFARMKSEPWRFANEWPSNGVAHARRLFPTEWDWRARVRSVEVPTLVVHGVEDVLPLAGSREWATTLGNARLLVIPDVGHFPHLEAPERLFPAIEAFLQGSWPDDSISLKAGGENTAF
jgi:proline iminopeptidase